MLPLDLFRDRRFSIGSGVITVSFLVMFGFFFLMTQYLQFARGYSPLEAGLAGLPLALAFVVMSPRSAALVERYGAHRVIALGLGIVAVGFAFLTQLSVDTPYALLAIAFAVLGTGMSFTAAPATGEIMTSVPLSKAGVGSAVNDTTRELGGAVGIALLGSVANAAYRSSVELDGLGLSAAAEEAAQESIGAASLIASSVPGSAELSAQAASAFTDAFTTANTVALGLVLGAVAAVLAAGRRRRTDEALTDGALFAELDAELVPVGALEVGD
jgi:fucose permease